MSGHSKWSNIKNRKAAVDKKKSEVFTRGAKEIMVAVRQGGGNTNPETNSFLRSAIEKARGMDMPKDNISRLLKRFEKRKDNMVSLTLEGFGPFGVPVLVEAEADNKNRILAEIKTIFRSFGGSLGGSGSVKFQFDRVGEVKIKSLAEERQLDLIDAGADEFRQEVVLVGVEKMVEFVEKVKGMGLIVESSRLIMRAKNPKNLTGEQRQRVGELVGALEENEDVINVFIGADDV